jgi:hypothetical protein
MPVLDKILELPSGFVILYHTCEQDEVDEKERLKKQIVREQVKSPRMLYSWESVPLFSASKRAVVKTIYDHVKQRSLLVTLKSAGLQLIGEEIKALSDEVKSSVVSEASKFIGSHFKTEPLIDQSVTSQITPRFSLKLTDDSKQQWTMSFSYIELEVPTFTPAIRLSLPMGTIIERFVGNNSKTLFF